jgi:uncharacterized ion transporter superfamily protein YfcC
MSKEAKKPFHLKMPSLGFIYLIIILLMTLMFFSWALSERWYNRVLTDKQNPNDQKKWEHYQQQLRQYQSKLAIKSPKNSKTISPREAAP